jgi:hypothetical protein
MVDRLTDDGTGSNLAGDLRYCITNATDGDDIQFGVTGTINLKSPLPFLTHSISVEGPGADQLTVRGVGYARIFTVVGGTAILLSGLAITNGVLYDDGGGGIRNEGTLILINSSVLGNHAYGMYSEGLGGGIYNTGILTVTDTTISANSASGGAVDCCGFGGGIFNYGGTLTLSNSTISGNSADGNGGGIFNYQGMVTVRNSTIAGQLEGRGVSNGGTLQAGNTIVASNTALFGCDLCGNLASLGHNLIGNSHGGSGFDDTDLLNVDPLLGPLQDNGGPTLTMALLPDSPAIDAGDNTDAPDWDQRGPGFPRITDDDPVIDIGAFEVQQDGSSGPARLSSPHVTALRFDATALLDTRLSQPMSGTRSEREPEVAVVDVLFGKDGAMEPGLVAGRVMGDALTFLHRHKESRLDSTQANAFDRFGVPVAD